MVTVSHREQINSAIGTWSGFIYQGLCGVLVALRMLETGAEEINEYKLQLDGYEDFSILDENNKIVSLHQCKCKKGKKDYNIDLEKMKEKRDALTNLKEGAKSYFHCNEQIEIDAKYNIDAYPFKDGKTNCGPGELKTIIINVTEKLKNKESDTNGVVSRLEALVNSHVLNTHQIYFDSDDRLYVIARSQSIPFAEIRQICDSTFVKLDKDVILTYIKSRYIEQFNLRLDVCTEEEKHHVELFMLKFTSLNEDEMISFMQRIHPKEKFTFSLNCLISSCSPERINYLFNLVKAFPMDTEHLHWAPKDNFQTPSTLASDQEIQLTCRMIYDNRANFDTMWIYDWFVGNIDGLVNESVTDIKKTAGRILDVENETNPGKNKKKKKKVGIMTLKDKKDGKFD